MNFKFVEALKRFIDFRFNASTVWRLTKNPDRNVDPGFWKFYPAGAVQVNSPVPFSERVDDRCCGI